MRCGDDARRTGSCDEAPAEFQVELVSRLWVAWGASDRPAVVARTIRSGVIGVTDAADGAAPLRQRLHAASATADLSRIVQSAMADVELEPLRKSARDFHKVIEVH